MSTKHNQHMLFKALDNELNTQKVAVEKTKALKDPVYIEKKRKVKKRMTLKELQQIQQPTLK